jgi:sugar phosphate isomerase/epimerase
LALENAGGHPTSCPRDIEELKRFVLELEGAKVAFDIGHVHLAERKMGRKATGRAIAEAIKSMRRYIAHVHVHDNHGNHDDHLPPGEGEINFKPATNALRAIGYRGLVIVELWNPRAQKRTAQAGLERARALFG